MNQLLQLVFAGASFLGGAIYGINLSEKQKQDYYFSKDSPLGSLFSEFQQIQQYQEAPRQQQHHHPYMMTTTTSTSNNNSSSSSDPMVTLFYGLVDTITSPFYILSDMLTMPSSENSTSSSSSFLESISSSLNINSLSQSSNSTATTTTSGIVQKLKSQNLYLTVGLVVTSFGLILVAYQDIYDLFFSAGGNYNNNNTNFDQNNHQRHGARNFGFRHSLVAKAPPHGFHSSPPVVGQNSAAATSTTNNVEAMPVCVVCLTNARDTVVLDCSHLCVCWDCAERMIEHNLNSDQPGDILKCPYCREDVQAFSFVNVP